MFFIDITEWVANWFWDTLYEILITIVDKILYSLVGFFYKVFIMLGTLDIFGGGGNGNEKAMEMFTMFTNRLYGVIGIIMVFVLAYQLIIYIIDPDKGAKDSQKLVKNLVKAIIIVTLLPLLFHYMAIVQKHVLEENVIWSVVLGTNGQTSSNAVESGNAMASMVYMTMFHPIGTDYNDFYDNNSQLKPYREACAPYAEYYGQSTSGTNWQEQGEVMSETSLSHWARWGLSGQMFFGTIGGVIGGIVGGIVDLASWIGSWFTEDESMTSCQMYWSILYSADGGTESTESNQANMDGYDVSSTKKLGNSNNAAALTMSLGLVDEIREEGTMEYMILAPIAGAILVFMLVGYSLDMAYRAFKLAFLELISPIPVLLGVIPKQEGIFNKWKDLLIKTYIDVFVRTFVMAFTVFMIQLVPTFIEAIFLEAFSGLEGDALLKAVTTIFLVLGLVRFAKELPDIIKDMAKSGSGLLKDINLNPMNSMKEAAKPIGALAGGALGAASAMKNNLSNNKRQKIFQRGADGKISTAGALKRFGHNVSRVGGGLMSGAAGAAVGGKTGWKNGLQRGSLTNSVKEANKFTKQKGQQLSNFKSAFAAFKNGEIGAGDLIGMLTDGRSAKFGAAWKNVGYQSEDMLRAGQTYRKTSATADQFMKGADTKKTAIKEDQKEARGKITQTGFDRTNAIKSANDLATQAMNGMTKTGTLNMDGLSLTGTSESIRSQARENASRLISEDQVEAAMRNVRSEDGRYIYNVNGKDYIASSMEEVGIVGKEIKADLAEQKVKAALDTDAFTVSDVKAEFGDKTFRGSEAEVTAAIQAEKDARLAAAASLSDKWEGDFRGQHFEGATFSEVEKQESTHSKELQKQADIEAISEFIQKEGGIDAVQQYAMQSRITEVGEADVLTDKQIAKKEEAMTKAINDESTAAAVRELANALHLTMDQMKDVRTVSNAMSADEFKEILESSDAETRKTLASGVGVMVKAMSEAQKSVTKSITDAQIATEGVSYDWLGRAEDIIGGKSSPGPKDDKK